MSHSNCCFLTCTQISQEGGQVVWYSHLFQNFPQFIVIHPVKGFGIVTFFKRLFSSSLLSAIRVVSSAYLRLLIFLLEILIPPCASSSPAFHMMYSAYKLNKQGDNVQPWCTPFPIWIHSVVPCLVLSAASWPEYRFVRKWSGIPMSLRIFQFVVIHTVKGFSVVHEAELDVFLEFSCFFYKC